MKSARPQPPPSRSLTIGMRAVGAVALALTLASCSLFGGDGRVRQRRAQQTDRLIPRSWLPRRRSCAASTRRKSSGSRAKSGGFQCAKVTVPLDYSKPGRRHASNLPRIKLATKGNKKGTLLVNPGGPGASGYDFVKDAADTNISDKVRAAYDLVGFDPRGVKRSAPVTCLTDAGTGRRPAPSLCPGYRRRPERGPGRQQGHRRQMRREDRPGPGPHRHCQRRQGPGHPAGRGQ